LPLHVRVPSYVHVEASVAELAVLLAERAQLAEEVDEAVGAGVLPQAELRAQLGAVEAGEDALEPVPRDRGDERVQSRARAARRRPPVHDLRHLPERDAREQARHAACTYARRACRCKQASSSDE